MNQTPLTTSNRFPNGLFIPGGNPEGQCYQTPKPLFDSLNRVFRFTVDACASKDNALLPKFWSAEDDALQTDWSNEVVFCNPPFNNIGPFLAKARMAKRAVVLAPLNYLTAEPLQRCPPDHIIAPKGRVKFVTGSTTASPVLGTAFLIYGALSITEQQALGGVCFSCPLLGRFLGRVFHANALELLAKLPSESIDAVISDPMYGSSANSKRAEYDWGKDPSGGDPEKHWAYHKPIYEECRRVLKPNGVLAWASSLKNAELAVEWLGGNRPWVLLRMGRRQKNVSGQLWLIQTKEQEPIDPPPGHNPIVFYDRLPKGGNPPHPCPKPSEELAALVKSLTKPGQVILDVFCGAGSTLVAAEQLQRLWIGGDRSRNYCQIAMRELARLKRNMQGRPAVR